MKAHEFIAENAPVNSQFTFDGIKYVKTAQGWVGNNRLFNQPAEASYLDQVWSTVTQNGTQAQQPASNRSYLMDPQGTMASQDDHTVYNPAVTPNFDVDPRAVIPDPTGYQMGNQNPLMRDPKRFKQWKFNHGSPQKT